MNAPTEEELIRYLDDQLPAERRQQIDSALASDPELASRLAGMDIDTGALRDAFEPVLADAPDFEVPATSEGRADANAGHIPAANQTRWMPLAASVLLALGVGYGAATFWQGGGAPDISWHQAVVDYQQLYTMDTLPESNPDGQTVRDQLASVSQTSGLTITPAMVDIPGLTFKRAQTLGHDDKPLVQLVFTDKNGTPVALCFMPEPGDSAPASARIDGMNTVTWGTGRYGFILVAHSDPSLLEQVAKKARLAGF